MIRRSLVGGVLLATIVALSAFWPTIPPVDKQTPIVPTMPPPTHVEWTSYKVGGLILVNPSVRDSTGRPQFIHIPNGSILSVPRLVPGPDPDSLDHERRKT